jgi:LCP family protein required for cell wall assembly
MADEKPNYTRYRSRPKLFGRGSDGARGGLDDLRGSHPRPDGGDGGGRRLAERFTFWRVLGYVGLAALGWLLLSLLLFLVSAEIQRQKVTDSAASSLTDSGYTLTSPNTVLVLGSDARTKGTKEPGAQTIGQPSRSDTIMLMRVGGGRSARLSIPRDTFADIPGHGRDKINAAYAIGGPGLAVKTVENYLGIKINHLVEVNFENFPAFIDSLGGIKYTGGCVISRINGGNKNGGYTLRLKRGTNHLSGKQALALARTRKNECNPNENDLTRARRQQKILAAIKGRLLNPLTFFRLPLVSWQAPKAIRSDMGGTSLLGLFGSVAAGGSPATRVLKGDPQGNGLVVPDAVKRREVERFLKG